MKMTFTLLLFMCLGCGKVHNIEDPHFKELIGTWSTVSDTEKQTITVTAEGKITYPHSAERGTKGSIKEFYYGLDKLVVKDDTLSSYLCLSAFSIEFYKKENVDSAYVATTRKIDNQSVVGGRSLFVKIK